MDENPVQHRQTPPAAPTPPPKHVIASPVPLTTKQRPATPVRGDSLLSLSAMPGAFPRPPGQQKGHLASSAEPDDLPTFPAEHNRSQSPVRLVSEDVNAVQREAEQIGQKERVRESDASETATPKLQQSVQPVSVPPVASEAAAGDAMPPTIPLDLSDRRRTALPIPAVTDRAQPAIAPVFAPGITAPVRIESHFGPTEKVETLPHLEKARNDHLGEKSAKKSSLGARFDALLHGIKRPSKTVDARRPVPQPFTLNPAELEARMNALIEEKKLAGSEQSSINEGASAQPKTEKTVKDQAVPAKDTREKHTSPAVAIGSSAADGGFAPLPSKLDREFRALAAGGPHRHDEPVVKNPSAEVKPSDHGGPAVAIGSPARGQEFAPVPADLGREFAALTSRKSFSGGERGRSSVASDSSRSKSSGRRTPTIAIGSRKEGQQFSPIPPKLESRFDALVHRKSISKQENPRPSFTLPSSTEKDSTAIAIGAKKDGQQFSPLPDKLADAFDELLHRRKSFAGESNRSAHSLSPENVEAASSTSVAIGERQSNHNFTPIDTKLESRFEALKSKLSPSHKAHDDSVDVDPRRAAHSAEASEPKHGAPNPQLEKEFSELLDKKLKASSNPKPSDRESSTTGVTTDNFFNPSVAVDAGEAVGEKPVADEDIYLYYIDASPVGAGKERSSLTKDIGISEPHVRLSSEALKGGEHDKPLRDPQEEHSYAAAHGRIEPVKAVSASSSRSVSPSVKKAGSPRASSPADRKTLESKFEDLLSRVSHPTQQISPYPAGSAGRSLTEVGHDEVPTEQDDEVPFVESEETLQKEYLNLMKQKKGIDTPAREAVTPPRADPEVTAQAAPTATLKARKSFSLGLLSKRDSSRNVSPHRSPGHSSEALLPAESADSALRLGSAAKVEERRRPSSTLETRFDSLMKRLRRSSTAESLKEAPTFKSRRSSDARQQEPSRNAPLVTDTGAQPSSLGKGSIPMAAPPVARAETPEQRDTVKPTPATEAAAMKRKDESARRRSTASASREPDRAFDLQQSFDNLMRRNPKSAASESGSVPAKSNKWLRKSFDGSSRVRSNNNAGSRTPTHISSSGQAVYDEEYRARQSMDAGNVERPAARAEADEEEARRAYPVPAPAPKKTPLMRAKKSLTDMMSRFKTGSKSAENLTAAAAEGSNAEPADTAASKPTSHANDPKRSASLDQPDTEEDSDLYVPDPSPLPAAYGADEDGDSTDDARETFHHLPPSEAIQFDPAGYGFSDSANASVSRSESPEGDQEIRIAMMQGRRR
ncbi:hypothetical protein HDU89_006039 [Geranomyces variabilis]|nr:hypothetical protein HDU89_006039 [Geranomyces variabilis]